MHIPMLLTHVMDVLASNEVVYNRTSTWFFVRSTGERAMGQARAAGDQEIHRRLASHIVTFYSHSRCMFCLYVTRSMNAIVEFGGTRADGYKKECKGVPAVGPRVRAGTRCAFSLFSIGASLVFRDHSTHAFH